MENFYSIVESDSRSSNFLPGVFTANSNGKQNGSSINFDGENSVKSDMNDLCSGEGQPGYSEVYLTEQDLLLNNMAAELSCDMKDPFTNSICSLQSVQEALEQELQKFGEIGNESKLEEARTMIVLKDSKVAELETVLANLKFVEEESSGTVHLGDEKFRDTDTELESLHTRSIEAEIECLAISEAIQNWKVAENFSPSLVTDGGT